MNPYLLAGLALAAYVVLRVAIYIVTDEDDTPETREWRRW